MGKKLTSVLTDDMDTCIFTQCNQVERHHVFGGYNRNRSEEYGFVVPLRPDLHPNGVHGTDYAREVVDPYLKETCQKYYEEHYGTREEFIAEFGRSYL